MALNSRRDLPGMVPMPSTPQYYVVVGTKKILVSLAVNLDIDDVVRMEVAKVVNLTSRGAVQEHASFFSNMSFSSLSTKLRHEYPSLVLQLRASLYIRTESQTSSQPFLPSKC